MAERKPVCKRFLQGECKSKNCKFYHPAKKQEKNTCNKQRTTLKLNTHHATTKSKLFVEPETPPVEADPKETITYDKPPVRERFRNVYNEEIQERKRIAIANFEAKKRLQAGKSIIITPNANPSSFGAKLQASQHLFDKVKFQNWLYNDMPNIDNITIINLYSKLLKKTEAEILECITKTNTIIPDIMALLGKGLTNKKWLKELHGRFLGNSYTDIKSFNMKSIKDLLTFSLVQMFLKTSANDTTNIEHIICLYVCIMRIIGKLGIVLDIDDIDTIERKYNSNMYAMFCN
jgi:hypothetical protein